MEKIKAIKLVQDSVALDLRGAGAKVLVERLAPLLQWNENERKHRKSELEDSIAERNYQEREERMWFTCRVR